MRTHTQQLKLVLSPTESKMLEHLAMAERVPKAFVIRRLVRDAARELYAVIAEARGPAAQDEQQDRAPEDEE